MLITFLTLSSRAGCKYNSRCPRTPQLPPAAASSRSLPGFFFDVTSAERVHAVLIAACDLITQLLHSSLSSPTAAASYIAQDAMHAFLHKPVDLPALPSAFAKLSRTSQSSIAAYEICFRADTCRRCNTLSFLSLFSLLLQSISSSRC